MDYYLLPAPLNKQEYLFFAAAFKHRTTFYKVAVAEEFTYLQNGYSGVYCVLLQSDMGTHAHRFYRNDSNVWACNHPLF